MKILILKVHMFGLLQNFYRSFFSNNHLEVLTFYYDVGNNVINNSFFFSNNCEILDMEFLVRPRYIT